MIPRHAKLRIARPTNNLEVITKMYVEGLGFEVVGGFDDHDEFSGRMVGHPEHHYHLEFTTHKSEPAGYSPSKENLLVFYVPDESEFQTAIEQISKSDFRKVKSFNPYWDVKAATFEDIDGYRVVITNNPSPF